jgi:TonB family protein
MLFVSGACLRVNAQQPAAPVSADRDRGIALFKKGDAAGAVAALGSAVKHDPEDLSAWHYLGLALELKNDKGAARNAFEKAARLGDRLLDKQLNQTPASGIGRALMAIKSQLLEAAESAEKYLALDRKLSRSKWEEWDFRASSLRAFADMASDDDIKTYSSKDVTTKVRVLSKPEATYTEEARRNQISGTIVVRCVFGANGKVFGIRPISSLAGGLTENAIRAARGITFIPATKDGRPVSVWMEVVYNFNIY